MNTTDQKQNINTDLKSIYYNISVPELLS